MAADEATGTLKLMHAFGARSSVPRNGNILDRAELPKPLHFVDDTNTLMYTVGRRVVVHNLDSNTMRFIPENDRLETNLAIAVSPSQKFAAVVERVRPESGPQKAVPFTQVSTYNLHSQTLKQVKKLMSSEISLKEWKGVCFSADSHLLAVQSGPPDWLIVIWTWSSPNPKQVATSSGVVPKGYEVSKLTFSPFDNTILVVSGPKTLQFYRHGEGTLKTFPATVGKREMPDITDHAFINDEVLVATTRSGEVWVFLGFDLKDVIAADFGGLAVTSVGALANGFVIGGEGGYLSVYENHERKEHFQCTRTFRANIPDNNISICGIATLPKNEDCVACMFSNDQVATFPLGRMDYLDDEGDHFNYLASGYHSGPITGMDCALNKPLVVTCGKDQTIRAWNYMKLECELVKTWPNDELLSLACHPDGFQILVGFRDKLRLLQITINDIIKLNEFGIKACRECRFSHGGSIAAAVNATKIQLYKVFDMCNANPTPFMILDGHSHVVKHISFQGLDQYLVSCSIDGTVYEWDLRNKQRVAESVEKTVICESAIFAEDTIITCGASKGPKDAGRGRPGAAAAQKPKESGMLRELFGESHPTPGKSMWEMKLGDMTPRVLCLTQSSNVQLLFVGMDGGTVQTYSYPSNNGVFTECPAHEAAVTHLCISQNDCYLFSASDDGAIFCYEVQMFEGGQKLQMRRPAQDQFVDMSLISRLEVDTQRNQTLDLQEQIKELSTSTEYKVHMKEQYYTELLKKQQADQDALRESEQQRYETLKRMKEKQELEAAEAIQSMEEAHMKAAEELEALYERKLAMHAARYDDMKGAKDDIQCEFEEKIEVMKREHAVQLERQHFAAEKALQEKSRAMEELQARYDKDMERYDVFLSETEEVAEIEIAKILDQSKKELELKIDENRTLKTEAALLRKNFDKYKKEKLELEAVLAKKEEIIGKAIRNREGLEKDIEKLKADVIEREGQIAEREKRISDLKNKARELEKFKFVLDYRNEELKKLIEPKNEELSELKDQIRELDDELQSDSKNKLTLQQSVDDKEEKLAAQQRELQKERTRTQQKERFINMFIKELHKLVTEVEPSGWREGIRHLHHTYVTSRKEVQKQMEEWTGQSDEIVAEFTRQREHLERSLNERTKKADKTQIRTKEDLNRKVLENALLIEEINDLRRDKKQLTLKLQEAESRMAFQTQRIKGKMESRGASQQGGRQSSPPTRQSERSQGSGSQASGNYRSVGKATPFDARDKRNQPYKGSTRQWEEMATDRARMAEMAIRLDENNREIEMQKHEIRRLREQVRTLLRRGSMDASMGAPDMGGAEDLASYGVTAPSGDGQQVLQGRPFSATLPDLPEQRTGNVGSRPPSQQSPTSPTS